MAERLTKEYYYTWDENGTKKLSYIQKLQNKLGKLEDILEKYGIESVEKLSNALEFAKVIENILSEYGIKDNEELDKKLADGITWQKACELACEREDDCYVYDNIHRAYEFYQQAKKEGNDERN